MKSCTVCVCVCGGGGGQGSLNKAWVQWGTQHEPEHAQCTTKCRKRKRTEKKGLHATNQIYNSLSGLEICLVSIMSVCVSVCQCMSVYVSVCQCMSVCVSVCQCMSVRMSHICTVTFASSET